MTYIRDLEKNEHSLDGLLKAIDTKTLTVIPEYSEGKNQAYVLWKESKIGITFSSLMDFLMIQHFDEKIIERCEYVRELWQNKGEKDPKRTSFIYGLTSNYYNHIIKDLLETYKNDLGYEQKRFKASINPKELDKLHSDFLIYMAICEVKYGQYNHLKSYSANKHLDFAKQIDSKPVNQLKKYGTGDIDKNLLEFKGDTISCKANDIYATINITLKEETEENYIQALQFIVALLETNKFPYSFQLKYSGKQKNSLPVKGFPKKPPHFFFANAIQFKQTHPLIEQYAKLFINRNDWYENVPDENPAKVGSFATFALGLENQSYLSLVTDYLENVDYEHQYLQENYIPVLVEKYGLNETIHKIVVLSITSADNFKFNKQLSETYNSSTGINLLKQTKLDDSETEVLYRGLFKTKIPKDLKTF